MAPDGEHMPETMDSSDSDSDSDTSTPITPVTPISSQSVNPMESKKKRKSMDKVRHLHQHQTDLVSKKPKVHEQHQQLPTTTNGMPELHVGAFRDLSSPDSSVREAALFVLLSELKEVQRAYEMAGGGEERIACQATGVAKMEAEDKDDGLENCAPSLRYALRRLIRGVSSSRECARQGFAAALTTVLAIIPIIRVSSVMKLIVESLEISSSMKGQEARDSLLGRIFAFGALARSGQMTAEWMSDNKSSCFEDFIRNVIFLAGKKQYLQEPSVLVILELVDKLPVEAIKNNVLEDESLRNWFQKAVCDKIPDALFLALKLQERVTLKSDITGELLPQPFSPDSFFSRDHLSRLIPCFQESTFCQPRVHGIWSIMINLLTKNISSQDDSLLYLSSSKKHKKAKKGSLSEDVTTNLRCFTEVVIEGSLLISSHDRKHLAFDVLLLLIPKLPSFCIHIILSYKLVQCLMDALSTKGTWLHNAAQHFLKELVSWVGDATERLVAVIVSLQKHSDGRFDSITRMNTVRDLAAKFKTASGCMSFVKRLSDLFIGEGGLPEELTYQNQTSDVCSEKDSSGDSPLISGHPDYLKNWIVDAIPRLLRNLKVAPEAKCWTSAEKFQLQTEIMKFLTVQGLFSASLGTEVTSFELQEKFKWPKTASSTSLCRLCIEQLQFVLEDVQKGDGSNLASSDVERNDLGSSFIRLLNTLCSIPSVSLFRTLSAEDEKAFKKLQWVETRLFHEEANRKPGTDGKKLHAMRYLLIQLLLQILLQPGEFSEASSELVICCKKAFPGAFDEDMLDMEKETENYDNGMPDMVDVLVDTLLSLLPQSSSRMCFAIEQVFRFYCTEITNSGLIQMLRVIKKDLKPLRHQIVESDDEDIEGDDDEDILGVEDAEDISDAEISETAAIDDIIDEPDATDDEMDDEAMFRMDSKFTQFLKKSGKSESDSASAQLMLFKLRILSLFEIYLHKNPGKPEVFTVFSHLARAYVKYHSAEGCKQLAERIWGILQKKIFKAKEYPKGDEIDVCGLEKFLEKSIKSASRARLKPVSLLAKNSTFWILKIIHSRNFSESELEGVMKIIRDGLVVDYLNSKKCRLRPEFIKDTIQRHPWIWKQLFGFFLEKCSGAKSEFRRIEALDLVDCVMKPYCSIKKGEAKKDVLKKSKFLKSHFPQLCELIGKLLVKFPGKQTRRAGVRRFCTMVFDSISVLGLKEAFLESLNADTCAACESHLGNLFDTLKNNPTL